MMYFIYSSSFFFFFKVNMPELFINSKLHLGHLGHLRWPWWPLRPLSSPSIILLHSLCTQEMGHPFGLCFWWAWRCLSLPLRCCSSWPRLIGHGHAHAWCRLWLPLTSTIAGAPIPSISSTHWRWIRGWRVGRSMQGHLLPSCIWCSLGQHVLL